MADEVELTMVTTVDADIHLFAMGRDMLRKKAKMDHWITTVDDHDVRGQHIVSVWTPDEHEVRGFMESAGETPRNGGIDG